MSPPKIRLGFDFDGVLVDKPPFIPQKFLEWLFKGGQEGLHYHFPQSQLAQTIRRFSHFYLLRPPLKKNIAFIKKLAQDKKYQLFLISSRYSFLEKETNTWLKKRGIINSFKEIYLNLKNNQPHLFKEKIIKDLKLDYYFEDDPLIANYLGQKLKKTRVCLIDSLDREELVKKFLPQFSK